MSVPSQTLGQPTAPPRRSLWARLIRCGDVLRCSIWRSFRHGAFSTAKAGAYSAILMFFPALAILASVLGAAHKGDIFVREITEALGRVLPPSSAKTAMAYFQGTYHRPVNVLISASTVMVLAASGVMVSWMQGFRAAYDMPQTWGFWKERGIALLLMLLSFLPLSFATLLVAFGSEITRWTELHAYTGLAPVIVLIWWFGRWTISIITAIAVIALIYHHGLPRTQPWHKVLPGAAVAAALWFPATIIFGWYVTRYATYNVLYGSIGATIALLVWLYMMSIIVLVGAEVNAIMNPRKCPGAAGS